MVEVLITRISQMDGIFPYLDGCFAITNCINANIVLFAIDDLKSTLVTGQSRPLTSKNVTNMNEINRETRYK
jgi:hypothetical protein